MLVGIRPRLLGRKRYRVCDVTDHRCGTRGTGRLFARFGNLGFVGKNSCAVAGKKKGSIGSLFISRRKKEVSCRKKSNERPIIINKGLSVFFQSLREGQSEEGSSAGRPKAWPD